LPNIKDIYILFGQKNIYTFLVYLSGTLVRWTSIFKTILPIDWYYNPLIITLIFQQFWYYDFGILYIFLYIFIHAIGFEFGYGNIKKFIVLILNMWILDFLCFAAQLANSLLQAGMSNVMNYK
jgi:ABC-type sugar transport system permease subunit